MLAVKFEKRVQGVWRGASLFRLPLKEPSLGAPQGGRKAVTGSVCAVLVFGIFLLAAGASELSSVGDVRALLPGEAQEAHPVRMTGTIIFAEPELGNYFVSDGSHAIFLRLPAALRTLAPVRGDFLKIVGRTEKGRFRPHIVAEDIVPLPRGPEALPRRVDWATLMDPALDAELLELEGRVFSDEIRNHAVEFRLRVQGGEVRLRLPFSKKAGPPPPRSLIGSVVRVLGVAGTVCNPDGQMVERYLKIPDFDCFTVLSDTSASQIPLPLNATDLLRPDGEPNQLVKLLGTVLYVMPGAGLQIRTESGSLQVAASQQLTLMPGERVEVVGFAEPQPFRPMVRASQIRSLGIASDPVPVPLDVHRLNEPNLHMDLVQLDGELLASSVGSEGFLLLCKNGDKMFEAVFPRSSKTASPAQPGCLLRMTGICELIAADRPWLSAPADKFRIRMRDARDLQILRGRPWWRSELAIWIFGGVGVLLFGSLLWVTQLRKHVKAQAATLAAQIGHSAVLEERQRIARDWHDTTDQQLMGVALVLERVQKQALESGVGGVIFSHLNLARRIVAACRKESRATLADLQSTTLRETGLAAAIQEFGSPLCEAAGMIFEFEKKGGESPLGAHAEHHVLRIACEAISNAAKHSGGKVVRAVLEQSESRIWLRIEDDGHGISIRSNVLGTQHFGIASMNERAKKIGASLAVESSPGLGTRICFEWIASNCEGPIHA
jgi:signal transduction histidine kinase